MSTQKGKISIQFTKNKKGNLQQRKIAITGGDNQVRNFDGIPDRKLPEKEISVSLLDKISSITQEGKQIWDVEFELSEQQQIVKLREQGQTWDREEVVESIKIPERVRPQEQPQNVRGDRFHNPYNFVPALPRDEEVQKTELGDHPPVGHGSYLNDYWSGKISVTLTTITPLLIPDAANATGDDHKTYSVRKDAEGKPYLPPTSIKGMLRSAYEAITNSRLSILEEHNELLAYRMSPNSGLLMVPARIENNHICLYSGTSTISKNGKPDPMYAAWLRRWDRNSTNLATNKITYANTQVLPEHGAKVKFWAEKFSKGSFSYWNVRKVVPYDQNLGQQPTPTDLVGNSAHKPFGEPMQSFEGYVCVTGKNMKNKHDERVFFNTGESEKVPLSTEIKHRWAKLIESYQDNEDFKNGLQCPSALGNVARWSRHFNLNEREKQLAEGTLCYAHVRQNGSDFEVIDLYPVMIARSLYSLTPNDILDSSLKPANSFDQLSPADRVFGWVKQHGQGAYKGQLRVHGVKCLHESEDAIDNFGSDDASFPLTILGQPKPEQARFYCADDQEGSPLNDGENNPQKREKAEGYKYTDQNLRGRKVYPHHKDLSSEYWNNPLDDRTQRSDNTGHYQEYRRPKKNGVEQLDKQNRSIKEWVKPETKFQFEIDVINLSVIELGALLWMLSSPDVHYHRLGGAKPLGFGSVWIDVDWEKTDLRIGKEWVEFYKYLIPTPPKIGNGVSCIDDFKKAVTQIYGASRQFDQIRFIAAFCNSSKGFNGTAIHYPRVTPHPTPEGEAFEWFVRNEQSPREEIALKLSLPDLAASHIENLPLNPRKPNPNNQQRRR
jgi:CRISPR-associated protein (TIGR03986 family)